MIKEFKKELPATRRKQFIKKPTTFDELPEKENKVEFHVPLRYFEKDRPGLHIHFPQFLVRNNIYFPHEDEFLYKTRV